MRTGFAVVVVFAVLTAWGPVAAQETVGTNTTVVQRVMTHSVGEASAWRTSVVGGAVRYEDRIMTGPDSRLEVELRDRSMLTVGANASLTVDRFVIDTGTDPLGAVFAVARGAFRFVSGSRGAERERVSFRTPTAAIGIRGTIIEGVVGPEALEVLAGDAGGFEMGDDPETAAVIVLVEGEIELELDGRRVTIREPGQAVAVSGRRLSPPFALPRGAGERFGARLPPRQGGPGAEGRPGQGQRPGQAERARPGTGSRLVPNSALSRPAQSGVSGAGQAGQVPPAPAPQPGGGPGPR